MKRVSYKVSAIAGACFLCLMKHEIPMPLKRVRLKSGALVGLTLLLLSGCVTTQPSEVSGFRFDTIEVLNRTDNDIFNMKIEVTKFHRKFACGVILRDSLCMNGFHPRSLGGNDVVISWEQKGVRHQFGPISAKEPARFDPDKVYAIQFVFTRDQKVELRHVLSSY